MKPSSPWVGIVEARWWVKVVDCVILSTGIYLQFPNAKLLKEDSKGWIQTKHTHRNLWVSLHWGCFPIRETLPFRCVCSDHPKSSSLLWGSSVQCRHQNSAFSETKSDRIGPWRRVEVSSLLCLFYYTGYRFAKKVTLWPLVKMLWLLWDIWWEAPILYSPGNTISHDSMS